MTRALPILAIALSSCAPEPLVGSLERDRITSFATKCEGTADECIKRCDDTFAAPDDKTAESWAICSDAVAVKFREGERT